MFQCKDLTSLASLSKLKLLAGSNGLHNGIRWVYKAESLQLSKWVHGSELLIISKLVTLENDFDLYKIISEAIQLKMSGALLLIGPNYVEKISNETIILCNNSAFPLFAIPWDLPLIDFFEEIGHAISNSNFNQNNKDDIIFSIIFGNNISPNLLRLQASESGYQLDGYNTFFQIYFSQPETGQINNSISEYIQDVLTNSNYNVLTSMYSNHIIGIVSTSKNTELIPYFQQIVSYIHSVHPDIICNVGIGMSVSEIHQLKLSYEQSAECITYSIKQKYNQQVLLYEQLGLYQLFFDIKDTKKYEGFVNLQIGKLEAYDTENSTELLKTLYLYLQNNNSILRTAEIMFTHRNTIKYRLSRIQEILGCNLDDSSTCLNLHVALYLKKFIL
jgi:hypothetical protein